MSRHAHHDHDLQPGEVERRERAPEAPGLDATLSRAVAAGRVDVLGAPGLLRLQRAAGNEAVGDLMEPTSPVLPVLESGGVGLPEGVRTDMETRFGEDFSGVRVHTDAAAHESAKSVQAHAFTSGHDIVFQRGQYDPDSAQGQRLLAHELTHVVQQRTGPVDGTPSASGVRVSDPSDLFEREAADNAERVMALPEPVVHRGPSADVVPGPAQVQREEEPELEEGADVQTSPDPSSPAMQREGEEEDLTDEA